MNIDEIINANMTVTDPLLRDAIRSVCVDAIHAAAAHEREECARFLERGVDLKGLAGDPQMQSFCGALLTGCAAAIRARGKE
jgi:hypothetical protein